MNNILIANIFSGIGISLLAISTFSKKKEKMLLIQIGDTLLNGIGSFIIGSYSGMITNLVSTIRNVLNYKKKNNRYINLMIILTVLIVGFLVNTKGFVGYMAPLASVEYSIWSYICKDSQSLRYGLLINILLWFIHDIGVGLYTSAIVDVLIIFVTIFNILRTRTKQKKVATNSRWTKKISTFSQKMVIFF